MGTRLSFPVMERFLRGRSGAVDGDTSAPLPIYPPHGGTATANSLQTQAGPAELEPPTRRYCNTLAGGGGRVLPANWRAARPTGQCVAKPRRYREHRDKAEVSEVRH